MAGTSVPMPWAPMAAIGKQSVGTEVPPARTSSRPQRGSFSITCLSRASPCS
ncbi:DUF6053 domain-containing protein [Lysobacter enzymogenes]|uniref:DUF6053 domain-containing protein n=1 Tax=Lysobacter enzymogenes TaxID=69 RepID=UPI0033911B92